MCCSGKDRLWVVLPYFNYCGFKTRRELFIKFVNEIRSLEEISIVIVEATGSTPLPRDLGVKKHLTVPVTSNIWIKESLVNLGIHALPSGWKYVAWIDADISFLNKNWALETIDELQTADVVQMFRTAVNLGPHSEALKIDKSFAYMAVDSGTPFVKSDRYGYWHPGYAWACTRRAWKQMRGLLDWAILGSADRHMALAWIGRVEESRPGNLHPNYLNMLLEYQTFCRGFKISYVDGTIVHHWHGRFVDRRYKERWDILTKNQFDPISDVGITREGLVQLTPKGRRLSKEIGEYFLGRKEDGLLV